MFCKQTEGINVFQHTAARRRLDQTRLDAYRLINVSTHSRPKAAGEYRYGDFDNYEFQHTAARRRLAMRSLNGFGCTFCFNTQPPEGGWVRLTGLVLLVPEFQHTAARRRLGQGRGGKYRNRGFNTQPPEGGWIAEGIYIDSGKVSTHSRPKAAGCRW